jgi:hypothetical protein
MKPALSAGLILFSLAVPATLAQPNAAAKVAFVEGQVEILSYGSQVPVRAEPGMTLLPGDRVMVRNGRCQLNPISGGILRLPPGSTTQVATQDAEDRYKGTVMLKLIVRRWVRNLRQTAGLELDDVFTMRDVLDTPNEPAPADLAARRAAEDRERLGAQRGGGTPPPAGESAEDKTVAEYRSLLPAALQADKKPWHTRTDIVANAVKTGTAYRVAYNTYCLIESGPDKGKDYSCYQFDSVLDVGALKTAVTDMRRRLGQAQ